MSPRSIRTRRVRGAGEDNLQQEHQSSTPLSSQQRQLANFTELSSENILEGSQKRVRSFQRWPSDHSGSGSASGSDSEEGSEILVGGAHEPITARLVSRPRRLLVIQGLSRAHFARLTATTNKRPVADVDDAEDSAGRHGAKRRKTGSNSESVNSSSEQHNDESDDADDDDDGNDTDDVKQSDAPQEDQLPAELDDVAADQPKAEVVHVQPKPPTRGRGGRRGGRWGRGGRGSRRGANLRRTASLNTAAPNGGDEDGGVSLSIERYAKAEDLGGQLLDVPAWDPDKAPSRGSSRQGRSTRVAAEPSEPPEDIITDADLPAPFLTKPPTPPPEQCADEADWLLRKQYAPLTDPQAFIVALTKLPPTARSTENLYRLALNTQKALEAWQDQYLLLDGRTAPHSNPPKKPANGGRLPVDPAIWEDMKEAELYNYKYDHKKAPGEQDPFAQRLDSEMVGGRELRIRRQRDVGDAGTDDEEAQLSAAATGPGAALAAGERRKRKTTQRFENTIETKSRKRTAEATPEVVEPPKRRRGRPPAAEKAASALLAVPPRLAEVIREGSVATTASDDYDPAREEASPGPTKHRGRPVGIKNSRPRSDKGIKKGPRNLSKSPLLATAASKDAPAPAATPAAATVMVNSLQDPFVEETSKFAGRNRTFVDARPPSMASQDARDAQRYDTGGRAQMLPPTETSRQPKVPIGPTGAQPPSGEPKRKQRVKSEKRSQSMTLWWASRKAAQEEKRRKEQQEERERWEAQQGRIQEEQRRQAAEQHEARMRQPPPPPPPQEQVSIPPPPQPVVPQPLHAYGAPHPPPPSHYPYAVYAPHSTAPPPSALPPPPPTTVATAVTPGTAAQPVPQSPLAPAQPVEQPSRPPMESQSEFHRHGGYQTWSATGPPPTRWESGSFGRISIPDIAHSSRGGAGSPITSATSPVTGSHSSMMPSPSTRTFQVSMPQATPASQSYPHSVPPPPLITAMPAHASQQSPSANPLPQPTFNVDLHSKKPRGGSGKFQALQPKPAEVGGAASVPPQMAPGSVAVPAHHHEFQQAQTLQPTPITTAGPMPPQGHGPVLAPAHSPPASAPGSAAPPPPPPSSLPHPHQVFHPYQHQLPPQHRPSLGIPFEPLPYQHHSVPPPPPPPASSSGPPPHHQRRDSGPRRRHTPSSSSTSQSWQPLTTMQIQTHPHPPPPPPAHSSSTNAPPPTTTTTTGPRSSPVGQMFDPVSGSMRERRPSESSSSARMRVQEGQGQSPTIRTNPTRFQNYDVDNMAQAQVSGGGAGGGGGAASQPHSRRPSQSSQQRPPSADAAAADQRRSQSVDPARAPGGAYPQPPAGPPASTPMSHPPHPPPSPSPSSPPARRQSQSQGQGVYEGRPQVGQQQQQQQPQQQPRATDNQVAWGPFPTGGVGGFPNGSASAKAPGMEVEEMFKRGSASPTKG